MNEGEVRMVRLVWADPSGTGRETSTARLSRSGCRVTGTIIGPVTNPFEVDYCVVSDERWRTREMWLTDTPSGRRLALAADGRGNWSNESGEPVHLIDGAIDVDVSATPYTNTLPIRRLLLPVGGSAEIVTAHVSVPDLSLSADPQRYTRTASHGYRYESLDSDFTRDVSVDDDGFVLEYPGLFSRIPAARGGGVLRGRGERRDR